MKKQIKKFNQMTNTLENNLIKLPTPSSISYLWNMGSMLGMSLVIQIISGIFMAMHYSPEAKTAFEATIHISRDVQMGGTIRSLHANMASMIFAMMFIHIMRGMNNSSFKKTGAWVTGTFMILILMMTAFTGYVLPWGQMSFWGATVITNLASAIPIWGNDIVTWLWGGFSVENPTLNRFFPIHFTMPFVLMAMAVLHLVMIHKNGSSNPTGVNSKMDMTSFHPKFSYKDILAPSLILTVMMAAAEKNPEMMMDPENFMPANPMSTPIHIKPEWYFLFAYAILRSIPNKLGGVMALAASIMVITTKSMKKCKIMTAKFDPKSKLANIIMACAFIILTFLGGMPTEEPYLDTSTIMAMVYFSSIMK